MATNQGRGSPWTSWQAWKFSSVAHWKVDITFQKIATEGSVESQLGRPRMVSIQVSRSFQTKSWMRLEKCFELPPLFFFQTDVPHKRGWSLAEDLDAEPHAQRGRPDWSSPPQSRTRECCVLRRGSAWAWVKSMKLEGGTSVGNIQWENSVANSRTPFSRLFFKRQVRVIPDHYNGWI